MRYVLLVLLNIPIILFAFINLITQYKLHKIEKNRFQRQLAAWTVILLVLICSFPIYNVSMGRPLLESNALDLFDIVQTTAIIYLLYFINHQHRKIELADRLVRDLHQELSIKLSLIDYEKNKR